MDHKFINKKFLEDTDIVAKSFLMSLNLTRIFFITNASNKQSSADALYGISRARCSR